MKQRKAISIFAFLICVATSLFGPLMVQGHWDRNSREWAAERRSEASTGVWVYGLGIDTILEPSSLADLEAAIGGFPDKANHIAVFFPGGSSSAMFAPSDIEAGLVAPVHLLPGTEIVISHTFGASATTLIGVGLVLAFVSWALFALMGLIGVVQDADGWRWRNRLIRISTYAGLIYTVICLSAFITVHAQ